MKSHPLSEDASHSAPAGPAQPRNSAVRLVQIWRGGLVRNFARTIAFSWRRLWRKPIGAPVVMWPRSLTYLSLAGVLVVALLLFVDAPIIDFMLNHKGPMTVVVAFVSNIGLSEWYLFPALIVYLAAATANWQLAGHRLKSLLILCFGQSSFIFSAVAMTGIAVNIVKVVVGRARPSMFGELGAHHFEPLVISKYFSSFPSGHATTLGAVAAVLMIWFPRHWLLIAVCSLGFSALRVVATAHYPSDVAGGFLFGWVLTVVMARMLAARRMGFRPREGKILPAAIGIRYRNSALN